MKRLSAALAAMALLGTTACGASSDAPESKSTQKTAVLTARVAVTYPNLIALTGEVLDKDRGSCETTGGEYDAIRDGAQVSIVNDVGKTVATAELVAHDDVNAAGKICAWSAEADGIPEGGKFYRAQIGSFTSEAVAEADLETKGLVISP